jgi:hypothetical protein
MSDPLDDAEIQIEIRPDGTVRFEVAGVPGAGCEALEKLMLEALGGEVTDRERTAAFYQTNAAEAQSSLSDRLRAWMQRK